MSAFFSHVTVLVPDYDAAIAYYTQILGFVLTEDTALQTGKRWVVVHPAGHAQTGLLLAKAATPAQNQAIGKQCGGRVSFFLHCDDFEKTYAAYRQAGVIFLEEPRHEAYGMVVVFEDAFGNKWDLLG